MIRGRLLFASIHGYLDPATDHRRNGDAGFVLTIPERSISNGPAVPGPREVAPWVAIVERLWDEPDFVARHRAPARSEAHRWDADRLVEQYETFFRSVRARH